MTSIAAYLAGLAGGAPQEGQKGTQAGATGTVGLFASILSAAQGQSASAIGEAGNDALLKLIASSDTTVDPAIAAQLAQLAENNPELAKLLSQGLPVVEGDVTAGITLDAAPATGPAVSAEGTAVASKKPSQGELQSQTNASQPPISVQSTADATAAVPANGTSEDAATGYAAAALSMQAEVTTGETAQRNAGLENALHRASETGQRNGLQNALAKAPQATSAQAGAATAAETPDADAETAEAKPARPRAGISAGIENGVRSDAQPSGSRVTVQRILDAGNGKSLIQIHERAGGETAGAASPPTLTVNVQASAASPGPASPNTPHVPVSALAVHIAQQHNKGARRFDIMMDPPELGRIEVRLDVTRDGQVTTHLVVERSETLDLLQRDARQLERALQGAGLNTSENGMKFSLKDQGLAQGNDDGSKKDDSVDAKPDGTSDESDANGEMPPPVRYMTTSALDIRI